MGHNNSFFYLIQKLLIITIQNKTYWILLQNATIFKLFIRNNKRDFNKNLFPHHFRKERTAANSLFYSDFFFPQEKVPNFCVSRVQSRACSNYAKASKKARSEKSSSLERYGFCLRHGATPPLQEIFLTHETNATFSSTKACKFLKLHCNLFIENENYNCNHCWRY